MLRVRVRPVALKDIDDQLKAEREEKMLAMWLACHDQREIAEAVGMSQPQVNEYLQKLSETEELPKPIKSAISHESDFDQQIYSVWSFGKAKNEVRHFGNIPPEPDR